MQNLELTKEELTGILRAIPGFDPATVDEFFDEQPGKPGIHFFKIRYADNEIVMPKGVYSDYAGVLLQGVVKVLDLAPDESQLAAGLSSCWLRPRPWLRRFMDRLRVKFSGKRKWPIRLRRLLRRREHDLADPFEMGRFKQTSRPKEHGGTNSEPIEPVVIISARDSLSANFSRTRKTRPVTISRTSG